MQVIEAPVVGARVRVRDTGAIGVVLEVFRRHLTADVDLGDGIAAEMRSYFGTYQEGSGSGSGTRVAS